MSSYVSLRDITTTQGMDERQLHSFVNKHDLLDELEYCLGLERGDIHQYYGKPLLQAELCSDMIDLLKEGQWALVPMREDLQSMSDLYKSNHAKGTHNRTKFTTELPLKPFYEYKFIGKTQPDGQSFHACSQSYTFPYSDFPVVRATLHPCFVFPYLSNYVARIPNHMKDHLTLLGDDFDVVFSIDHALNMFVYLSFLGNTHTSNFPGRRIPSVILDRPLVETRMAASQPTALSEATPAPDKPSKTRGSKHVRIQSPSSESPKSPKRAKLSAKKQIPRPQTSNALFKKQPRRQHSTVIPSGRKRKTPQTLSPDETLTQRRRSTRLACL
ncbi:hypothetical protein CPB85DRAFT_987563 [Mucidula mucida]|nr:hypothetical protein CPB85DRAFT_987563 [Mucidula mucida]